MATPPMRWAIVRLDNGAGSPAIGGEGRSANLRRAALVVSNEAFHRGGFATVCPIVDRPARTYRPSEVGIPAGHAGFKNGALVLAHQLHTVSLSRLSPVVSRGLVRHIRDARVRRQVREALLHHLGLDLSAVTDGGR